MKKEKIVIIGANAFQNKLIEKAKEKGYETHVFAWESGDIGETTADFFYPISITEKEKIFEQCNHILPSGICSIGSDLAVPTVNYVADKLGLIGNDLICSILSTDKYEMRKTFVKNNLPTPKFCLWEEGNTIKINDMKFPLIVKPTDRSGSRGVTKVTDIDEVEKAIKYAQEVSFNKKIIVEEYVDGEEYSVEYISFKGKHYFLAATKKFTTGAPYFVELAHCQPAKIEGNILRNIKKTLEAAFDALHISNGASHSEVMICPDGNIKIIEIGSRMGGDCIGSDLVPISTGYDYVGMVIDVACGRPLSVDHKESKKIAFIKFILSEKDIQDLRRVKMTFSEQIKEINFNEQNKENHSCNNSAERSGYYIMEFDKWEEMIEVCEITGLDLDRTLI